jgi:outer membrane protein assembly factor BamE (lipoprotein component of BamABCDE complex)
MRYPHPVFAPAEETASPRPRTREYIVFGLIVVGIALILQVVLFALARAVKGTPRDEDKITRTNYRKIRPGMSRLTVEALLGGADQEPSRSFFAVSEGPRSLHWSREDPPFACTIEFEEGKVVSKLIDDRDPKELERVTWENYDRIRHGMTLEQVTELLGEAVDERPFAAGDEFEWDAKRGEPGICVVLSNGKVLSKRQVVRAGNE